MGEGLIAGNEEGPSQLVLAVIAIAIVLAIFTGCRLL